MPFGKVVQQHGFVIVSKDSDFQQRSLLYGNPPKVVWIRLGNSSVKENEKGPVIFIGHHNTEEGIKRSQRLFLHLNKMSQPNPSTSMPLS